MSYYEDFIEPNAWAIEELYWKYEKLANKGQWETREGEILDVKDMQTSHIKNCIAYIKRKNWECAFVCIPMFEEELKRRGDNR